jgi:hypothetical protein
MNAEAVKFFLDELAFDDKRLDFLRCGNKLSINCTEAVSLLDCFGFDDGKAKGLELLLMHVETRFPAPRLLSLVQSFSFDDTRVVGLRLGLAKCGNAITEKTIVDVISAFSFDSGRVKALNSLLLKLSAYESLTTEKTRKILFCFSHGDAQMKALNMLAQLIVSIEKSGIVDVFSFESHKKKARKILGIPEPVATKKDGSSGAGMFYVINGHRIQLPTRCNTVSMSFGRVVIDGELYFDADHADEGYWPLRNQLGREKEQMSAQLRKFQEERDIAVAIMMSTRDAVK